MDVLTISFNTFSRSVSDRSFYLGQNTGNARLNEYNRHPMLNYISTDGLAMSGVIRAKSAPCEQQPGSGEVCFSMVFSVTMVSASRLAASH